MTPSELVKHPLDVPAGCEHCHEGFSPLNVFSDRGWDNTYLKGICERCDDKMQGNV